MSGSVKECIYLYGTKTINTQQIRIDNNHDHVLANMLSSVMRPDKGQI